MNGTIFISAFRFPTQKVIAMPAWRDFYKLHQLVYAAFPTKEAATAARPLFRFDLESEQGFLYVQTTKEPDWTRIPEPFRNRPTPVGMNRVFWCQAERPQQPPHTRGDEP